jgi:hypothetical protein
MVFIENLFSVKMDQLAEGLIARSLEVAESVYLVFVRIKGTSVREQNFPIAGNSSKALTTTLPESTREGYQDNDLGYGNNVRDRRTIRSGVSVNLSKFTGMSSRGRMEVAFTEIRLVYLCEG